jgi:polyferredoxin
VLAIVSIIMLMTLSFRHTLELDVLRDRNPDHVTLADGAVRNGYTVKLMNRMEKARTLRLSVSGIRARQVKLIGDGEINPSVLLPVEADKVRTLRILVTVAKADLRDSTGLTFTLGDAEGHEQRSAAAVFVSGEKP